MNVESNTRQFYVAVVFKGKEKSEETKECSRERQDNESVS